MEVSSGNSMAEYVRQRPRFMRFASCTSVGSAPAGGASFSRSDSILLRVTAMRAIEPWAPCVAPPRSKMHTALLKY